MRSFNCFIDSHPLVDLPLKGIQFTWLRSQKGGVCSPLNRFLFTSDWMEQFQVLSQEALPNPAFDHTLIFLRMDALLIGPRPFRFEVMWLKILGFKEKLCLW